MNDEKMDAIDCMDACMNEMRDTTASACSVIDHRHSVS